MIKQILIVLAIFIALAFVVMWILSGGVSRIGERASGFSNCFGLRPGSSDWSAPPLPWQVPVTQGTDIQTQIEKWEESRPIEDRIADLEDEFRSVEQDLSSLQNPPAHVKPELLQASY